MYISKYSGVAADRVRPISHKSCRILKQIEFFMFVLGRFICVIRQNVSMQECK